METMPLYLYQVRADGRLTLIFYFLLSHLVRVNTHDVRHIFCGRAGHPRANDDSCKICGVRARHFGSVGVVMVPGSRK